MMTNKLEEILYIGNYDKNYARNHIFIKGLIKNQIKVYEFNIRSYNLVENMRICLKDFKKLKFQDFNLILMYDPNFIQLLFAKILSKEKKIPLVHDKFVSKLQTFYFDRKLFKKNKMPRLFYRIFLYMQDFIETRLADYIISDTHAHIMYFHKKYHLSIKKFRRIFIGAQDEIFFPYKSVIKEADRFVVGFWGTFIPLQGIQYILKAAKILEKDSQIKIILIGNGQTYEENCKLAKELNCQNVDFLGFIPLKYLPPIMVGFDIGLGIFGDTPKATQVIPNKVFEGNACKIPMISCDNPAIRELYKDGESIILCKRANPDSLANAILKLKNDIKMREKIKENAYLIYKRSCSTDAIGKSLYRVLSRILKIPK